MLQNSFSKVTKKAKLSRAIGSTAMRMANAKGDRMAIKAARHKKLWKALKIKILAKYGAKARQAVMGKRPEI